MNENDWSIWERTRKSETAVEGPNRSNTNFKVTGARAEGCTNLCNRYLFVLSVGGIVCIPYSLSDLPMNSNDIGGLHRKTVI